MKANCRNDYLLLACVFCLLPCAFSNERLRPNSLSEMASARTASHVQVQSARVAWADYGRLKRDYPQLKALSEPEIDQWIIGNFGYVSEYQLQLQGIRIGDVAQGKERRKFAHPRDYYRAGVAEALYQGETIGLMDLKGTGLSIQSKVDIDAWKKAGTDVEKDALRTRGHSDGMMSLGEAFAEVTRQRAAQMAFEIHNATQTGPKLETVENYFVIDLGVDILKEGQRRIPAAILGRQPHFGRGRSLNEPAIPSRILTDHFGGLQRTTLSTLIDFGGVTLRDPDLTSTFGVPEPLEIWDEKPQESNAWRYGHETAEYFRRTASQDPAGARKAVQQHIDTMTQPPAFMKRYQSISPTSSLPLTIEELMVYLESDDIEVRSAAFFRILELPEAEVSRFATQLIQKVGKLFSREIHGRIQEFEAVTKLKEKLMPLASESLPIKLKLHHLERDLLIKLREETRLPDEIPEQLAESILKLPQSEFRSAIADIIRKKIQQNFEIGDRYSFGVGTSYKEKFAAFLSKTVPSAPCLTYLKRFFF